MRHVACGMASGFAFALMAGASAVVVNGGFELPGAGFRTVHAGQTYDGWTAGGPSDTEFVHATVAGPQYEISVAMAGNVWAGPQIMGMNIVWNGGVAGHFTHDTTGRSGDCRLFACHGLERARRISERRLH